MNYAAGICRLGDFVAYYPDKVNDFRDLRLNFCGRENCDPYYAFGPAVRPNYIIHYILKGRGRYEAENTVWDLEAGDGFLIEPGTLTYYQADKEDPWSYIWIGFEGSYAGVLLRHLGLCEGHLTFHCEQKEELLGIVTEMIRENGFSVSRKFLLESFLYRFFSILLENSSAAGRPAEDHTNIYVRSAAEYIRNHYFEPIRVQDIADYLGINRSYLYTLFTEQLGTPPQTYLTNYRLSRGAELLSGTAYSIESIALSCGYPDPQLFSRLFKKHYGRTPTAYRKEEAGISSVSVEKEISG